MPGSQEALCKCHLSIADADDGEDNDGDANNGDNGWG